MRRSPLIALCTVVCGLVSGGLYARGPHYDSPGGGSNFAQVDIDGGVRLTSSVDGQLTVSDSAGANSFNLSESPLSAGYLNVSGIDINGGYIELVTSSQIRGLLRFSGYQLASGGTLQWSNSTTSASATADSGIARESAGVIRITDGSTGRSDLLTKKHGQAVQTTTLAAAATTLALTGGVVVLTGDAGTNLISTITGGVAGQLLTIIFTDALVSISDNITGSANTINIAGAFTSTADDVMQLVSNGTSWREVSRSVN